MASPALSRRVEKVVRYPPLVEMDDRQRREFHEALLDANSFEDLPGKWQATAQLVGRKSEVCSPAGATHILESSAQRLPGLVVRNLIAEAESIRTSVVRG